MEVRVFMRVLRLAALAFAFLCVAQCQQTQDWTHYVRISGNGVRVGNADQIVKGAADANVFGIEVDNDIPGRYDSWLDPTEKLEALRQVAAKAHAAGNYTFVYVAGTECITANASKQEHSMFKDHPDWIQRNIKGEPAMFGGGVAFWVREGDEDVWVSPFAPGWLKIYMERIRQIAATGIDGIYVDIPYWMTHFKGWTDTWASFDDYTVAAFKAKTGLNAKTDLKLGDFRDANFRKWVDFRIDALTEFMHQIDVNAKSVNPKIKTIAEIYPGIEEPAVVVGTDVYDMYAKLDTIAHEYSSGGMSARRTPLNWFENLVGMYSFRAFAQTKPTWMLSYSWENDKTVTAPEAMKNLSMAQGMAQANDWDPRGHGMSGTNDAPTRKAIFGWLKDHEKVLYEPRETMQPIGVYFSPKTRNYFAKEFINAYRGTLTMLMQSHMEFQVVTPRTLDSFRGEALILPDVRCISQAEVNVLRSFVGKKALIVNGETGKYDETGAEQAANPVLKLLGISNAAQKAAGKKFSYDPQNTGAEFYAQLQKEFNSKAAAGEFASTEFDRMRKAYADAVIKISGWKPAVEVEASPFTSAQIAKVQGKPTIFLANFKGLKGGQSGVGTQMPEQNVKVSFHASRNATIHVLPFMGEEQKITGTFKGGMLTGIVPEVTKGAIIWVE
jgi:hypothetical protein